MDKKAILDELVQWNQPLPIQPEEFTKEEFRDRLEKVTGVRLSHSGIRSRLEALLVAGKITKRKALIQGHLQNAFKQVVEPESDQNKI